MVWFRNVLVLSLLGVCACSDDRASPHEPTARTSAAISNGSNDSDTPEADVVVNLSSCTGTLVAPSLVLTANHCITGGSGGPANNYFGNTITVGNASSDFNVLNQNPSIAAKVRLARQLDINGGTPEDNAEDIALIVLQGGVYQQAAPRRPTFVHPAPDFCLNATNTCGPNGGPGEVLYDAPPMQIAGWGQVVANGSSASVRQVATASAFFTIPPGNAGLWTRDQASDNNSTLPGDSGGPLYTEKGGFRDVVGVASAIGSCEPSFPQNCQVSVHADITDTEWFVGVQTNPDWIIENATDHSHDNQPRWLSDHPIDDDCSSGGPCNCSKGTSTVCSRWYGEADYVGPCQHGRTPDTNDTDCDHWYDAHDNCPFVANSDQLDNNDDGVGNACVCPCDPGNDQDGDGLCGTCSGSVNALCSQLCSGPPSTLRLDDCPAAYDPNQDNCNIEAEQAANARAQQPDTPGQNILGDACDPVPCPLDSADTSSSPVQECCPNPGGQGQQCYTRKYHDNVTLTPVDSHPIGNTLTQQQVLGGQDNGVPVSAIYGGTEARFCQSDVDHGFNCDDTTTVDGASVGIVDPRQLTFWANADAEQGNDPLHPWHRMTLGQIQFHGKTSSCAGDRGTTEYVDFSPTTNVSDTWCYASDWTYWLTGPNNPKIPLSNGYPACQDASQCAGTSLPGTCLGGSLWRHSDAVVGFSIATVDWANGPTDVGLHSSEQPVADHYFGVLPDQAVAYCPLGQLTVGDPPTPRPLPQPSMLWQATTAYRAFDIRPVAETELLLPSDIAGLAALLDDGGGVAVGGNGGACSGSSASTGFTSTFTHPGLSWASAVEPSPAIGSVDSSVMAVALSTDGTTLVDAAIESGKALYTATELPNGGGIGLGSPLNDPPSPRQGFTTLFSRAAGGAYVIGGQDQATHEQLNDIWFFRLGGQWARSTYTDYDLGSVLAATFSFADDKLWLLDQVPPTKGHGQTAVRLARLDPFGGSAQIVGSWPLMHSSAYCFLSVVRDGGVLLNISRDGRNATVRFTAGPDAKPTLILRQAGALAIGPVIDSHSYAFVGWKSANHLRITRRSALDRCDHYQGCCDQGDTSCEHDVDDCNYTDQVDQADVAALF
jgi:hypothetical protein